MKYDEFIICPVRGATKKEKRAIDNYIKRVESEGKRVYYPPRDTDQNDPVGLEICKNNRYAIRHSKKISVYWNGKSTGSVFDFGMYFMELFYTPKKKIKIINKDEVLKMKTSKKSFHNVLLKLSE